MKRSEFIAGFQHARRVAYAKAVKAGTMRPSEAAMGLGDAKRDAIAQWRCLADSTKAQPRSAYFNISDPQPSPAGSPIDWAAPAPDPVLPRWAEDSTTREVRRDLAGTARALSELQAKFNTLAQCLETALEYQAREFGNDEPISGADLLEWFAGWRLAARLTLSTCKAQPRTPSDLVCQACGVRWVDSTGWCSKCGAYTCLTCGVQMRRRDLQRRSAGFQCPNCNAQRFDDPPVTDEERSNGPRRNQP